MADLQPLYRLAGTYRGHKTVWTHPGAPPIESDVSATASTVAGGLVFTLDYSWATDGGEQDGRLLIAPGSAGGIHISWCDSWHVHGQIMELQGDLASDQIAATGSYVVSDSEPWRWRIEVEPRGVDAFQVRMFNILPASMGGAEMLGVQIDCSRS